MRLVWELVKGIHTMALNLAALTAAVKELTDRANALVASQAQAVADAEKADQAAVDAVAAQAQAAADALPPVPAPPA